MSAGKRGRFWVEEEETTCCFITVWNWNGSCESKRRLEGKQSKIRVDLGSCVCKPAAHISPAIPACFAQLRWTSGNYVRERWRRNVRGHFRKLAINELWCVWWHFRKEMSVSTNRVVFPSDHLRICSSEHVLSKHMSTKILTEGAESSCKFDIWKVKQWKRAAEKTVYRGVMLVLFQPIKHSENINCNVGMIHDFLSSLLR